MRQNLRKTVFVRLDLVEGQEGEVKRHTGRDSKALELAPEEPQELEERAVPRLGWTANHNETMLDDAGC